jgi:hypothetical protein
MPQGPGLYPQHHKKGKKGGEGKEGNENKGGKREKKRKLRHIKAGGYIKITNHPIPFHRWQG